MPRRFALVARTHSTETNFVPRGSVSASQPPSCLMTAFLNSVVAMDLDRAIRRFFERPAYQRLFLAFTLGLFISCSVKMAGAETAVTPVTGGARAASR